MPEPGDDDPDDPAPEGRPPPPSLLRVLAVAALVVAFVLAVPALYVAGRDLTGSAWWGSLFLAPPAAALGVLYLRLFRR